MREEDIVSAIRRNLLVVMPDLDPRSISVERHLADLGCNSIDRTEVIAMTMEDLSVTVPVAELGKVTTIRTLVELLQAHL